MATFKDQLDNYRIKTLSQDLLQQPTSVGQYWDTMGLAISDIVTANFWDLTMRPLQTNDVICARIHDASDDSAILGEMRFLSAYCHLIDPKHYVSQLLAVKSGEGYVAADIADVNNMTTATSTTIKLLDAASISDVYVFFDGKLSNALSVTVAGSAAQTIAAGSAFGEALHFSSLSISDNKFAVSVTATAGTTTAPAKLHVVAVTKAAVETPTIDLTSDVTGVLPVANGGTGLSSLGTAGQVLTVNDDANAAEWAAIPQG